MFERDVGCKVAKKNSTKPDKTRWDEASGRKTVSPTHWKKPLPYHVDREKKGPEITNMKSGESQLVDE